MKVDYTTIIGFSNIYTDILPHPDPFFATKKKPYIAFSLPLNAESDRYIGYDVGANQLLELGNLYKLTDQQVLYVTGIRKIILAIQLFLGNQDYDTPTNVPLATVLHDYLLLQEAEYRKKPQKTLPIKSKPFASLQLLGNTSFSYVQPVHQSKWVKRVVKGGVREYFYKAYPCKRAITEIEAFNGICFRLLLGKQTPKVRSVHDELGERVGVISKRAQGFLSFHDMQQWPSRSALIQSEVCKILVAAYCEEENDLHGGNYGFITSASNQLLAIKVDHDQATWPLTSKYASDDPAWVSSRSGIAPNNAFPVTARDILNFPKLKDAKPFNFIDRSDRNFVQLREEFFKSPIFIEQKYYIFLKRILLDADIYQAAAEATISSPVIRAKIATHKSNRTYALKYELLKLPEFRRYVLNNPNVINSIIDELAQYNKDYKSSHDSFLRVNIDKISQQFDECVQLIKGEEMKEELLKICDDALALIRPYCTSRRVANTAFFKSDSVRAAKLKIIEGLHSDLFLMTQKLRALYPGEDVGNIGVMDIYALFSNAKLENDKIEAIAINFNPLHESKLAKIIKSVLDKVSPHPLMMGQENALTKRS